MIILQYKAAKSQSVKKVMRRRGGGGALQYRKCDEPNTDRQDIQGAALKPPRAGVRSHGYSV